MSLSVTSVIPSAARNLAENAGRFLAAIGLTGFGCARRCAAFSLLLVSAGCQLFQPTPQDGYKELARTTRNKPIAKPVPTIDPTRIPTHDDIFQIAAFWPQVPWIFRSEQTIGFQVPVYFRSSETQRGVFVPGTIAVTLNRINRRESPALSRQLAHRWELDQHGAMPFRLTREARLGYGYGFVLTWPEELDIAGSEIEILFSYTRADGKVISSQSKRMRVPLPQGYERPLPRARPRSES